MIFYDGARDISCKDITEYCRTHNYSFTKCALPIPHNTNANIVRPQWKKSITNIAVEMVTGPIQSRQPMALRHFAFLLALKLCILNNLFAIITHMWPLQDNTLRRKSDFFKWVSSGKAHYTCKPIFFEGCFPNLLDNGRLLTFLLFSISIIEVLVSIQDI
jgi:hypothetical protein